MRMIIACRPLAGIPDDPVGQRGSSATSWPS
jgi:hypothetical protein